VDIGAVCVLDDVGSLELGLLVIGPEVGTVLFRKCIRSINMNE
jgi:hypothetical protein